MGYADTLLEGEYDKETQNRFLNVIATEARRMAKLVTDLLTLSRYDSKKIKVEETEFDLGELVKRCQEKLRFEIEKKNHSMECFVTASVPPVEADKDGIERVVLNILSNAIKYTPDNGTIKVYVGFVYNDAYIKVIDNGVGIPKDDLSRIFDRFYRVDKARTRELGGTGLGLSIAKEILNQNKGSIDIKSEVKTASLLLADAAFNTGKYIQGFPEYGPERMGAPITAYNRISDNPIRIHSNIYEPDYVVVVDDTLLESVDVTAGLKESGAIVINTTKDAVELSKLLNGYKGKIYTIDARKVSMETLGRYFPNTPMLAAIVKVSSIMNDEEFLSDMEGSFKHKFAKKPEVIEGNMKALKMALQEVKLAM